VRGDENTPSATVKLSFSHRRDRVCSREIRIKADTAVLRGAEPRTIRELALVDIDQDGQG